MTATVYYIDEETAGDAAVLYGTSRPFPKRKADA